MTDKDSTEASADTEDAIMTTESPKMKPQEDAIMEETGKETENAAPTGTDVDMSTSQTRAASPADSAMGDDVASAPSAKNGQGPPVPPRPEYKPPAEKQQVERVERWAQQQDVREVLGNVLLQLRWAIKGKGLTEKGDQVDLISQ